MKFPSLLGAISVVIACAGVMAGAEIDWTVYLHHSGPVRIGMSLAEVRLALNDPRANLSGNAPAVPLTECAYLESNSGPEQLGFMFAQGRVVRIDVFKMGIRTASSVGVGDTEDKIKQLYRGRITIEPHHYIEKGHYLIYSPKEPADSGLGMVFETDGEKVDSFRTGTLSAIALVEGCS
jgi:hypothetical protein